MSNEILLSDVARDLGAKESEVIEAFDSEAGLVVALFDGTKFIFVPEDRPDAEGKSGLMFFTAPDVPGDKGYTGDFPVYAQPLETDDADVVGGDVYPEKGNLDAVLQWVAGDQERAEFALEQENTVRKTPRKNVVEELEAILRQYAANELAESAEAAVEAGAGAAEAQQ